MVDDLKKGYYLLFVDGGKRASERGVEEALEPFKTWQLSWVPREMNKDADELVDQAFKGEPVAHATD